MLYSLLVVLSVGSVVATPRAAARSAGAAAACGLTDDGRSDLVVRCASLYSVSFSRSNGALTAIRDAAGALLSAGSRNGCLYGAANPAAGTYCGSCGCGGVALAMAYAWRVAAPDGSDGGALVLNFAPSPANATSPGWAARVTLTTRPALGQAAAVFDLSLALVAPPGSGAGYTELLFPSELLFSAAGLRALHLPIAPGAALLPPFFAAGAATGWNYPGSFSFASFAQLDFGGAGAGASGSNGTLVVEDLSGPDVVVPVQSYLARAGGAYAPECVRTRARACQLSELAAFARARAPLVHPARSPARPQHVVSRQLAACQH